MKDVSLSYEDRKTGHSSLIARAKCVFPGWWLLQNVTFKAIAVHYQHISKVWTFALWWMITSSSLHCAFHNYFAIFYRQPCEWSKQLLVGFGCSTLYLFVLPASPSSCHQPRATTSQLVMEYTLFPRGLWWPDRRPVSTPVRPHLDIWRASWVSKMNW